MSAYFIFILDDDEQLIVERIYFDTLSMLEQLIGGMNLRDWHTWPVVIPRPAWLLRMSSDPAPTLVHTTAPDRTRPVGRPDQLRRRSSAASSRIA